jgi:phage RecT family recombinase
MPEQPRKTPPSPTQKPPTPRGQTQAKPAAEPPPRVELVRTLVSRRMKPAIQTLLGKGIDFDRFARVFLTTIEGNADLLRSTDGSIARAFMHSAEVGLQVGGAYPHAYLIPYWNKDAGAHEVQFQISVWGYTELVRRAGVRKVWADVVCEHDEYQCISGTAGKIIKHNPNWFASREERGQVIGAYACAMLANEEIVCEPASIDELELARAQNKGKSPAWDLWFEQQCQKVVLKRLSKYLPKGEQPDRALAIDEDPNTPAIIDVPGFEVPGGEGARPSPVSTALDDAVAQARAAAANGNGDKPLVIDRNRLHAMLCDLDEKWRPLRGRIEAWDEMQALQAMAWLNAYVRAGDGGELPEQPAFLRLDDEVIT